MISLQNVTKRYQNVLALDQVSYTFEDGKAYGILGVNGAGKSTLIHCLTHNVSFEGEIQYDGQEISNLGYVPQELAIYPELSVMDNLLFFASLYKMNPRSAKKRAMTLVERVGLGAKVSTKVKDLSGGMKRKLNVITGLIHHPQWLVCDEVCVGIDPISRQDILDYLQEIKEEGIQIFYTSHYLDEVEYLCDHLLFLDEGKIVLAGETRTLIQDMAEVEKKKVHLADLFVHVLRKEGDDHVEERS